MDKNSATHILVIRLSALGDVAMTVPVLNALVQQHPELKITLLTRSFFKPMFQGLQNVEVYKADVRGKHKGVIGLWKLYKELKKIEPQAVADLHNVLRSNILKRYFGFDKIVFKQIDKGRKDKKALTASRNKVFKPLQTTHERYADVFRQLGYPITLSPSALLPRKEPQKPTLDLVGPDHRKWIGIAPFAAFTAKMYPLKQMEEVIEALYNTDKYKIILFGGGGREIELLQAFAKKHPNVISAAGQLPFGEELALISNLDLMLSMDSGNGHLAAMFGIPVVTVWGVTHPYAGFAPFGQPEQHSILVDRALFPYIPTSVYGNKLPKGYEQAIGTISPEQILSKIDAVLS